MRLACRLKLNYCKMTRPLEISPGSFAQLPQHFAKCGLLVLIKRTGRSLATTLVARRFSDNMGVQPRQSPTGGRATSELPHAVSHRQKIGNC